jgi:ABC-2 type transport system ATP-binding protein
MQAGVSIASVDGLLDRFGLGDAAHRRVGGFSLGMRQRLALASALVGDPSVLILDEPLNGLDPDGIRDMRRFLRSFADAGGTVFLSSHLLSEVAAVADDLVVINRGSLAAAGPVGELVTGDTDLESVFHNLIHSTTQEVWS